LLLSEDHPTRNRQTTRDPRPVMPRSDTFPCESVSTTKDPTRVPAHIADQTGGHNQGATEHFVRRVACAAPLPHLAACELPYVTRLETAPTGCLVPSLPLSHRQEQKNVTPQSLTENNLNNTMKNTIQMELVELALHILHADGYRCANRGTGRKRPSHRTRLREGETTRSCRLTTLPPIDIGEESALVCGLPTAIKG